MEDDSRDSGASFSVNGSGVEDNGLRSQWFPLRPSAVGEDDEETNQVAYTTSAAFQPSSGEPPQNVPPAWSDDDAKQSPPERSQPDGRDGPDLKRPPWVRSTFTSTQQTVTPPVQKKPVPSGSAEATDSGSDTSVLSQPRNDNATPLEIITRSVPPAPRGAAFVSELRRRHAPQLNSDSDTESPVSKLLGPNFRAVQQVLNRLKQDRLTGGVSDEAEHSVSEQQSLREESQHSLGSTVSTTHGTEGNFGLETEIKTTKPTADAVTSLELNSSRLSEGAILPHAEKRHRDRQSEDEARPSAIDTFRKSWDTGLTSSWTNAKPSHRDASGMSPAEAFLNSIVPPAMNATEGRSSADSSTKNARILDKDVGSFLGNGNVMSHHGTDHIISQPQLSSRYSTELRPRSSVEDSLRSSRIAWGDHSVPVTDTKELPHRRDISDNAVLPSRALASRERLHEISSHSSTGGSVHTLRAAWREPTLPMGPNSREPSLGDVSEEMSGVIPADNLEFPGQISSVPPDGTNASGVTVSGETERAKDLNRTEENHVRRRTSDVSVSSDDTDDLLTYEPVLEGDRQYLQMQKRTKHAQQRVVAMDQRESWLPTRPSEFAKRKPGQELPPPSMEAPEGIQSTPADQDDSQIKALHWSLGAGTISPISYDSVAQSDSQHEGSSTPVGPALERSSVLGVGALQEQSLQEEDTTAYSEDRDAVLMKQHRSHSITEVSSSDEMYRPVLYRDAAANKENHPDESAVEASPYGIYDIRKSSGPGSTNRRRKALGLQPNPARDSVSQEGTGMVYISGSSTPSSVRGGRDRFLRREETLPGRHSSHDERRPDKLHEDERFHRNEELKKPPKTKDSKMEKEGRKSKKDREMIGKRDYQDTRIEEGLVRERSKPGHPRRNRLSNTSSKESTISGDSPEDEREPSRHSYARSRQPPSQYMDTLDPNVASHSLGHGKRSARAGKSKTRYTEDDRAILSQRSRLETSENRKDDSRIPDAKGGHSSRDKSFSRDPKTSRMDANISRLTSLITKSLEESISSSSLASTTTSSRRPSSKSKKAKLASSTSESSDVSEYFNYAFFEPRLRTSIGQKIKLRELLRSVKSRDLSPIVRRTRDSTSPESTSGLSSNDGVSAEKEPEPVVREPLRSDAAQKPAAMYSPQQPTNGPRCTCARAPKAVTRATSSGAFRSRREGDGRRTEKRDVGVNCPTPVMTRDPSPVEDEVSRVLLEDASTQTDEVGGGRRVERKVDCEPEKSPRKSVKSKRYEQLSNVEERGVISQPSPKKLDLYHQMEQREARHKPKERLVPSQNSPDHRVRTSPDWRNRAQEPAWFYPLKGKPQPEQKATSQISSSLNKSRTKDELRADMFEASVNPSSTLQQLSLQEAFLYARPKFVKRSQDRVAQIEQAAREKERRRMFTQTVDEEKIREEAELRRARSPPVPQKAKPRVSRNG